MEKLELRVHGVKGEQLDRALDGLDVKADAEYANIDVVTISLMAAGALVAGKFIIRLWKEFRGGTVIDLTKTPVDIKRNPDLDWGFFLIVAKDGTVKLETKGEPEDSLERMVESLLNVAKSATVDVAKASIKAVLGERGKISTSSGTA